MGLWEWAVFVAMHLDDPNARAAVVKELLARHIELVASEIYHKYPAQMLGPELLTKKDLFLTRRLGVAEHWLHTAKAWQAQYSGNSRAQILHHLLAKELHAAHEVFLYKLAPNMVFGDLRQLHDIAAHLAQCRLPGWHESGGGSMFKEYVDLMICFQSVSPLLMGRPMKALPENFSASTQRVVPRALALLKFLSSHTFPAVMAISPSLGYVDSSFQMALSEMASTLSQAVAQSSQADLDRIASSECVFSSNSGSEPRDSSSLALAHLHLSPGSNSLIADPCESVSSYGHPENLRNSIHSLANSQF
ncbi:Nuclear pore complex protein Nup98-Nup96 [Entomophthora muscae]|uniref:Nuclear pore complex protein Nup98-Nup96 n=1 Tax=Entomophthora muscae TaxID=34485 RepID=A0ACC2TXZ7_9FUNG|nr:Nuclear pore complex protein Nup98-Nup96 [Entomophthora muscae]